MYFRAEEKTIAGSQQDTLEVRHLKLKGSNQQIGQELARIAKDRHKVKLGAGDPLVTRASKEYFERNYPVHFERMKGVAKVYGVKPEGPEDTTGLAYNMNVAPGCSTVFYPPEFSSNGHGILSRNYDFSTGPLAEMMGMLKPKGARAMTGDPYLIEVYPDRGYPALYMCAYDILGGCIDGINSEGLTVALLADDESSQKGQTEPSWNDQAGFNEIQITRFLLDTCACVEDAKQALLMAKQYYSFVLCHYIIADRHGKSFVWEYSHAHNKENIVDGAGKPQVVTNHPVHRYKSLEELPEESFPGSSYVRYRKLMDATKEGKKFGKDEIIATNCSVAANQPAPTNGRSPGRTLWHAVYDTTDRSVEIDFYLAEDPSASNGQKRSGYQKYKLG